MKQFQLNLAALRGFVAVAEHGSFTAAAATLGVSKVFLSRSVAALERGLGAPLFVRTTRSLRSTEAGEVVLRHGRHLLERAEALDRAVADVTRDPGGRLRIVASHVIYDLMLESVVIPFMQRYPRVTLELDVGTDLSTTSAGFDLALFPGPAPDSSMGSLLLGKARLGCFASADYLEKHGTPATPEALLDHAIVAVARSSPLSWSFSKGSRATSITVKPRLAVATHDLALRAVASGAGIGRLPLFVAYRSRAPLVPLLARWAIPDVAHYAVFPGHERPTPAVRVFLDLLKQQLRPARR